MKWRRSIQGSHDWESADGRFTITKREGGLRGDRPEWMLADGGKKVPSGSWRGGWLRLSDAKNVVESLTTET